MTGPGNGADKGEAFSLTRLIKLLKLTTSTNNAEALLAMRKANEELKKLNKDWEEILTGRIMVVGDPFAATARPTIRPSAPPQPKPAPPPPRSFSCYDCGMALRAAQVHYHAGHKYCLACYQKATTVPCADCGMRTSNFQVPTYGPRHGQKLCPSCYTNATNAKSTTITNKFGKACISCGTWVEAGSGKATKHAGTDAWVVHHDTCDAKLRRHQAPSTDQL